MDQVETTIIGAGVVGLAISHALAQTTRELLILEANGTIGQGISSRNSEVIHAGLYYPHDALKTRLCTLGNRLMYQFAADHQIPHAKIGKLVIASNNQKNALAQLYQQAQQNQVEIEWLSKTDIQAKAPAVRADCALFSPNSGIIDSHQLMHALLGSAQNQGATLALDTQVERIRPNARGFELYGSSAQSAFSIQTQRLIIAAGLGTHKLVNTIAPYPKHLIPTLYMAKGDYFKWRGKHPFTHLIYPLPDQTLGGLGVHLTLDMQGQARFGPDVEYTDTEHYQVDEAKVDQFYHCIRTYWPDVDPQRLSPDYAGIRPKLVGPRQHWMDFCIHTPATHKLSGLITLMGIESPGLTAALAIADLICQYFKIGEIT